MAQELPTELPPQISHGSGLTEDSLFPNGCSFRSPQGWQTKAAVPEGEDSSPFFTRRSSCVIDTLGRDDDFNGGFPLTFPRLYSDLTSKKDPFLDNSGMPLNPNNTPICRSGRQSETGSWRKDKQNAPSPVKYDRNVLGKLNSTGLSREDALGSLLNGAKATPRPPKPPKPPFLSAIYAVSRSEAENIRPSRWEDTSSSDRREGIEPRPVTPYRSLPLRAGREFSQRTERPPIQQAPEPRPSRPKPWETRSVVPCRYFPRPFTHQELETLGIPLNNPDMPFPAPIPTIDNLPLRRGIVEFDWKQREQCPEYANDMPALERSRTTTAKPSTYSIWRLLRRIMPSTNTISGGAASKLQERPLSVEVQTAHTALTIPCLSKCKSPSPDASAHVRRTRGAYVLQLSFTFPLLSTHHLGIIVSGIHGLMSSKIATAAVYLLRAIAEIIMRWLLMVSGVEVIVELRRIRCGENTSL